MNVKGLFLIAAALMTTGDAAAQNSFLLKPLYFAHGEATLTEASLARLAEGLQKIVEVRGVRYVVRGHADRVESAKYKEGLSQARAEAVRDYLVAHGAAADDIRVMSFGSSVSMTACAQREAAILISCLGPIGASPWRFSRRCEISCRKKSAGETYEGCPGRCPSPSGAKGRVRRTYSGDVSLSAIGLSVP